jgi:hypothetical protein
MGLRIGLSSNKECRAYYPSGPKIGVTTKTPESKKKLPNPDPNNCEIIQAQEVGKCLIIKINYPDCTTYEGNKILLFRDITLIDLVNQRYIDPHFFEDKNIKAPIARFVPTDEGWGMAVALATMLVDK